MYKILHIPTGEYVKGAVYYSEHNTDMIIENLPEDSFDRSDILRAIIFYSIPYNSRNNNISMSSNNFFSEFEFVEVKDV